MNDAIKRELLRRASERIANNEITVSA